MKTRLASILLAASALSPAAVISFYTPLAPEVAGATGTGSATVALDTAAQTLVISTQWSGLSGLTTVAHIHCCVAVAGAGTVGVAVTPGTLPGFPTGVSAGSYAVTLDLAQTATYTTGFLNGSGGGSAAGASAALLQGMLDGKAYLNIHSTRFPAGEIRGFLAAPEPATSALAALALGSLAFLARRRRRQ